MSNPLIDRLSPARRPVGPNAGVQRWRDLLFVHFEVPVEEARALLPAGLELDLWQGKALVGLVPFAMEGVRPRWLPRFMAQTFLETNVRLYVTHDGRPGVYFLSLEAASWTAVRAARAGWGLPYHHAQMIAEDRGAQGRHYSSVRRDRAKPHLTVAYTVGPELAPSGPETLAFFLLERYLLFVSRRGAVQTGQVHHTPYPAHEASVLAIDETLIAAAGLTRSETPFCAHYSPGVDVEVFGFRSSPSLG